MLNKIKKSNLKLISHYSINIEQLNSSKKVIPRFFQYRTQKMYAFPFIFSMLQFLCKTQIRDYHLFYSV